VIRTNCNNWTGAMCEGFHRTGVHDPLCCNARNQGPNPRAVPLKPDPLPHFGGTAPHRYENGACVYCNVPEPK
jgi:hypothetical protein